MEAEQPKHLSVGAMQRMDQNRVKNRPQTVHKSRGAGRSDKQSTRFKKHNSNGDANLDTMECTNEAYKLHSRSINEKNVGSKQPAHKRCGDNALG
jgi:hypothetical protein